MCVQAALFFNQYVNPIALEKLGWKYYIVSRADETGTAVLLILFNKTGL